MLRPISTPFRAFAVLFVLMLAVPALAADALPYPDDSEDWREALLAHRRDEAATKAARAKAHAEMEAAKTANQGFFDVTHYDLEITVDDATNTVNGYVVTTAVVTGASITTMDLNLDQGMNVGGATAGVSGDSPFSHSGGIVTVTLDRTYTMGETVVVGVYYNGNPAGGSFGWSTAFGRDMIWTLSEPYGAREWWPCKDLNSDKADSVDITVTVRDDLVVASNGLLQSNVDNGATRTFHWKSNYPIVTYLVSLAIYPYQQYSDWYTPQGGGDDMEVQFYVYPEHFAQVQTNYDKTVPMINTFAQAFGEYPFVDEKYGHAEFTWGGGMEHQTISSMGGAGTSEDLISHELAHQWFGDMITCETFSHIWLNEGFATWSEAYWAEQTYGDAAYKNYMSGAAYFGSGTIYVANPNDFGSIFNSSLSYNKASWVVHMLRGVLGDTDFFAALQLYRSNHLYSTATTEDLQAVMETVSGLDLEAFFQQWIYGEYFPVYALTWTPGVGQITVTIDQVQTDTGLFTMPIQLAITTDLGTEIVTVQNSLASENYVIDVTGTVEQVVLDPDKWILKQTTVTDPALDQGILLVNGVEWSTYGTEITSAYEDSVFWGSHSITFWDCFPTPAGGYPANLPAPLGHGSVPAEIIGNYSTVIWVGNNYAGDLGNWGETPVQSYLEAGGNMLLMSRHSASFLDKTLDDYLGVTFAESGATLNNCVGYPGMFNIPFIGDQTWNDVFYLDVGMNTTLLFAETVSFPSYRGTGAVVIPPGGGTWRTDGGRLAHIAGRPYRMDHTYLRQNVEIILGTYLLEPYVDVSAVPDPAEIPVANVTLGQAYPNPFNPRTVIPFSLPRAGRVDLAIYDARGRLVRRLAAEDRPSGDHEVVWNGLDESGRGAPSGAYFARLSVNGVDTRTSSLVLVR